MLLILDHEDSFTYNLADYFARLNQDVRVYPSAKTTLSELQALVPQYLVLSPGPGHPSEAKLAISAIHAFKGQIPILGVCLGHQCIAQAFGARIVPAKRIMHGETSAITHSGSGLFTGLPSPLTVARYHSWVAQAEGFPNELEIQAQDDLGEIMAFSHRKHPIWGVQFHPEAILTQQGWVLCEQFLKNGTGYKG